MRFLIDRNGNTAPPSNPCHKERENNHKDCPRCQNDDKFP